MFLVEIYEKSPRHEGTQLVAQFVCVEEGRANYHAGKEADCRADETGAEYDYTVTPVEMRT